MRSASEGPLEPRNPRFHDDGEYPGSGRVPNPRAPALRPRHPRLRPPRRMAVTVRIPRPRPLTPPPRATTPRWPG